MKSPQKLKTQLLKDKEIREDYDALGPKFELAVARIIEKRKDIQE